MQVRPQPVRRPFWTTCPLSRTAPPVALRKAPPLRARRGAHAAHLQLHLLAGDLAQLVVGEGRLAEEVHPVEVAARASGPRSRTLSRVFCSVPPFFVVIVVVDAGQNLSR